LVVANKGTKIGTPKTTSQCSIYQDGSATGAALIAYNLSAIQLVAAGALFTAECLDPTPADLLTCSVSGFGAAFAGGAGLVLGSLGTMEVKEAVIPGIMQAATCTP
jgi:hypothetical protein